MIDKRRYYSKSFKYALNKMNEKGFEQWVGSYAGLTMFSFALHSLFLTCGVAAFSAAVIKDSYSLMESFNEYKSYLLYLENMQDEDYLRVKRIYDIYVKKLADFIKKQNFTDPLDVGLYFDAMLYSGNLSENHYRYKKTRRDNDVFYQGTVGARVISSYGVCRNASALLTDLYKELGYDAVDLVVNVDNFMHPHAACLVSSSDGCFIIDPTWRALVTIDDNNKKSKEIISWIDGNHKNTYCFRGYNDDKYCYHPLDNDFIKSKGEHRIVSEEYLKSRYNLIARSFFATRFYDENETFIPGFYEENEELIKFISNIEQSLTRPKVKKKK